MELYVRVGKEKEEKKMKAPCAKCKEREVGCRTDCEAFQKYQKAKDEEYAQRQQEYMMQDYFLRSVDRVKKARRMKR